MKATDAYLVLYNVLQALGWAVVLMQLGGAAVASPTDYAAIYAAASASAGELVCALARLLGSCYFGVAAGSTSIGRRVLPSLDTRRHVNAAPSNRPQP